MISISGILCILHLYFAQAEGFFLTDILKPVIAMLFIIEIHLLLNRVNELHFLLGIYIFTELLWLIASIVWFIDNSLLKNDATQNIFYMVPSFLTLISQGIAVFYFIIKKYKKWNRYSFISKYFLITCFAILLTNQFSPAAPYAYNSDIFTFTSFVIIIFIISSIVTIAISRLDALKKPSYILFIISYLFILFGSYMIIVPEESILYIDNYALINSIIIFGNFLLIISFYFEKKYPWLSYSVNDNEVSFNKTLYYIIGILIIILSLILLRFEIINMATALVAGIICLCFIILVSEQHNNMLREQLYIKQQALNTQLEDLVEKRTTSLRLTNDKLQKLSITDPLTGIYNRIHFMEVLNEHRKRPQDSFSLIYADINSFSSLNKKYGIEACDLILKAVGTRLYSLQSKDNDSISTFRLNGNSFGIILDDSFTDIELKELELHIKHILEEPLIDEKNIYRFSFSLSRVNYPQDTSDSFEMPVIAEERLKLQKKHLS
ncbi:MAG: GGDEF domain-containing protein [Butyrivibrio sp.]|nr:GGDEF domain-containing protein [Butyrivibrio sp.]